MLSSSRYTKLTEFGKKLLNHPPLHEGLLLISETAKNLLDAYRCSIYIYNEADNELWTTIADGVKKIKISADKGFAGYSLKHKEAVISNNPYHDERFLKDIDQQTGFITENIASVPVFSSDRRVIGVLQLLNKTDGFNDEDLNFMLFFAHYISTYLELEAIYAKE